MTTSTFRASYAAIQQAAWNQNGWSVWAIYEEQPRRGTVPTGTVLIEREEAQTPFPDRPWATARWADRSDGPTFFSGNYDMTREDAVKDFAERCK